MVVKADAIQLLADGLALAYHEARHVRFLTKAGHLPLEPWASLIDLPRSRVDAWRTLLPVRNTASARNGARAAAEAFEEALGRTAADLAILYSNPNWSHAEAVGGQPWRHVVACILTLRDTIDSGNLAELDSACAGLVYARHNNGHLRDKIAELDRAVGFETHQLWRRLVVGA